jgi:hypothetical protein
LTKTKVQWKRRKSSREESAKFTTSLYRSPKWVRIKGQVPSLPISLYRSPFAGAKFTNLPLQIPPYRQMKKKKKISNTIPATLMKMVNKLMGS